MCTCILVHSKSRLSVIAILPSENHSKVPTHDDLRDVRLYDRKFSGFKVATLGEPCPARVVGVDTLRS